MTSPFQLELQLPECHQALPECLMALEVSSPMLLVVLQILCNVSFVLHHGHGCRSVFQWLQIQGLPTMIFIGTDNNKPALRTEGLLPAETIKNIIAKEL